MGIKNTVSTNKSRNEAKMVITEEKKFTCDKNYTFFVIIIKISKLCEQEQDNT